MHRLLRRSKLALLTVVLALGGLVTAAATPAAHAASLPSITAFGGQEEVEVQGSGFTPGGSVWIGVFDTSYRLLNSETVTASQTRIICYPHHPCAIFAGGTVDVFVGVAPYYGYVHVLAADDATATWSNEPTTYVRIIP